MANSGSRRAHWQNRRTLMGDIGTLPGERLAGLLADLCHKVQHGGLTLDELALFTQRKNPFSFMRNEHGHFVFKVTGLDLTGKEELRRLTAAGFCTDDWPRSCLLSKRHDGYDKNHRLVEGQEYQIVLMPTDEIMCDTDCTNDNLRKRGTEKYGYGNPLAGIAPRILESVSDRQMKEMGFRHIIVPHNPIKDRQGSPSVFCLSPHDDGLWLSATWFEPCDRRDVGNVFAFIVPAS
ncbi:hypothetical protein CL630_03055 [bacterium]|nr:hypothetical protein [bacterium]